MIQTVSKNILEFYRDERVWHELSEDDQDEIIEARVALRDEAFAQSKARGEAIKGSTVIPA